MCYRRPVDRLRQSEQVVGKGGRRREAQRANQSVARYALGNQAGTGQCDTKPQHHCIDQHPGLADILAANGCRSDEWHRCTTAVVGGRQMAGSGG